MKRALPDSDAQQNRFPGTVKRPRKPQAAVAPNLQPSALTEEALDLLQHELAPTSHQHCVITPTLGEEMERPITPRSASNRGRRSDREPRSQSFRSRNSRTPSPSKKPSPQTYRTRNLHIAGVLIERLYQLPSSVDEELRRILGIETWDHPTTAIHDDLYLDAEIESYLAASQKNAKDCALEGDWKASLYSLVKKLSDAWTDKLKTNGSEKVWNSALKPTGPSLDAQETEDVDTRTSRSGQFDLPVYNPTDAAATFDGCVPSLPPSVAPTFSTDPASPYHISTPKPDITLGLDHNGFELHQQQRLVYHQAFGSILSDPHAAEMGIRFPFLIGEAKGLSQNGNLVSAQNQASVAGASMLAILNDLRDQAQWNTHLAADNESAFKEMPVLVFSIVTEGAIHEMWVHFEYQSAYHAHCFRSFRATHFHDTKQFVLFISRIVKWGAGAYRDGIMKKLDQVPRGLTTE